MGSPEPERAREFGLRRVVWELALLLLLVVGSLSLFVDKCFTIDEPVYLCLARHLVQHPLDFGGARMNWYGTEWALHEFNQYPPLIGYLLALAGSLIGWSEVALHSSFLLSAAACVVGTYWLARRLCARPMLASIVALMTPAFLVSSTTVMADTTTLAFWLAAIACSIEGFDRGARRWLWAAAACIALAGLTKYSAIALLPLLFAYGVARERRVGRWALPLLVPALAFAGYEIWTHERYGGGMLLRVASYASLSREHEGVGIVARSLIGLSFVGGGVFSLLPFAPLMWGWRAASAGIVAIVIVGATVSLSGLGYGDLNRGLAEVNASVAYQFVLCVLGGASALALAAVDLWRRRDADSILLCLWVLGVFTFASELNWTANARSVLPLAPALGILLARRLEDRPSARPIAMACAAVPGALLALAVAHADYTWAAGVRDVADAFVDRFQPAGARVFNTGHWGFQYYLEDRGIPTFDVLKMEPRAGDFFLCATVNANTMGPPGVEFFESVSVDEPKWVHTMAPSTGAGLYSSLYGPLPFSLGPSEPDLYYVMRATR